MIHSVWEMCLLPFLKEQSVILKPLCHVTVRVCQSEASAAKALNRFVSGMYHADLWIPRSQVVFLVQNGEHFIKAYCYLAFLSNRQGEPKFSARPKLHMLHEAIVFFRRSLGLEFCYNIIAESCSVDEDMVGRIAFLTRHVSPRLTGLRTLERYLTQVLLAWTE